MNFGIKIFGPALLAAILAFGGPALTQEAQPVQRTVTPDEAVTLLTKAAEEGQGQAMLSLGSLYENGIGVPRNYTKALQWYQKAAEAKMAEGFYNLGVCYEIGLGTAADEAQALKSFKKAADMNLAQAYYKLSSIYLAGNMVKADVKQALAYLNQAAEAGHSLAANELGVVYLNGLLDQKADGKKALQMFTMSAELGNPEAMKNIAVIYKDGLSRDKDPANALKWYLIAKGFGYQPADIDEIIADLKKAMKEKDIQASEEAAAKWLDDFRAQNAG